MNTANIKSRILIVEDEAIVAADIQQRLDRLGYEIVGCADTGAGAIEKATALRPELVLMDITLKGKMMGTEAASHIRKQLHLPVIYLTANSDDAVFRRARETAPFGFILKPFDEFALKATIEIALHNHRIERDREELIQQLQSALTEITALRGLLPLCSGCQKIRDHDHQWKRIEQFVAEHPQAAGPQSCCPECEAKLKGSIGLGAPSEFLGQPKGPAKLAAEF
jgi:AmiR/NasT family two-component response regulator